MANIKLLYAIHKNLQDTLKNINILEDSINKQYWYNQIEGLLEDIEETIEFEKMKY